MVGRVEPLVDDAPSEPDQSSSVVDTVVFVRKVRAAPGATAVQIAARQGGRDKVVEHLGSAHTDAELSALLEAARREIYPSQGELDLAVGSVPAGQPVITGMSSALLWHAPSSDHAWLGFDAGGDTTARSSPQPAPSGRHTKPARLG